MNAAHINPFGSLLTCRCKRWLVNISVSKILTSTAFIILVGVESASCPPAHCSRKQEIFFPCGYLDEI